MKDDGGDDEFPDVSDLYLPSAQEKLINAS